MNTHNIWRFTAKGKSIFALSFAFVALVMMGFKTSTPAETTAARPNVWFDLVTPDLEGSKQFYQKVFGWTYVQSDNNGLKNSLIKHNGKLIGSMFEVKKAPTATWIAAATVNANNFEKQVQQLVKQNGVQVAIGLMEIPGRGSQVVIEGAQGEEFSLIAGNNSQGASSNEDGSWLGAELWASDVEAAKTFYSNAFNVSVEQNNPDGKPHWYFMRNGEKVAAMIHNPITNQGSQWVPYINYSDVKSITSKAKSHGGLIVAKPNSALNNGRLAIIQDPNGALFCIQSQN